jgi:hypothetical protein
MKTPKLPVLVWAACLATCILSILWLDATLPERVVSHFGSGGRADGWTTRSSHTVSFVLLALGLSSFVSGIVYSVRFFSSAALNVPNAQYWRSPEHFRSACEFLFVHSFWLGALSSVWWALFNYLVVRANRLVPPALDSRLVALLTLAYFAAIVLWGARLRRYFTNPDNTAS